MMMGYIQCLSHPDWMPSLMMMPMFLGSSFVLLIVAHSLYPDWISS